jgi:hypothetical protein
VLKGRIGQYVFVSTISVYAARGRPADETAPLAVYQGTDPMAETTRSLSANPKPRRSHTPLDAGRINVDPAPSSPRIPKP